MTALDEIRAGQPSAEFALLVQRTIRATARRHGFPPPDGHQRWDDDALRSVVTEFFADSETPRRLTDLQTHCRTEDALRYRLQGVAKNFLADLGRATPIGRLVLRVNDVLKNTVGFNRASPYWSLDGADGELPAVNLDALIAVASGIDVVVPTAWATGDRESPEIDPPSLVAVARALLTAAGGALTSSTIARVLAARLGIAANPLLIDTTASYPSTPSGVAFDATADAALCDMRAEEIFEMLKDNERIAVGCLVPVEELGHVLGVSGSQAHNIRKRAGILIRQELEGDDDREAVAAALAELARKWTESWMSHRDPT